MPFNKINYFELSAKQKEVFNFQKISSKLADYGFKTIKLSDDWNGADFIAQHFKKDEFYKIQLKGRLTFDKKYSDKALWICFRNEENIYLYPHDELLNKLLNHGLMKNTKSWDIEGGYSFPSISKQIIEILMEYKLE